MIPQAYGTPAAIVLVLTGALTCFAGYRLIRIILGIYGFILGAMIASSTMGGNSATGMVLAAVVGGLVGAVVLVFAYYVGIAIVGAGLGALIAHVTWTQATATDPPAVAVVVASVAGAIGAMLLQRYVIVVATAFAGAWTLIIGAVNLMSTLTPRAMERGSSATEVWILYPTSVGDHRWAPIAWIVLGLAGTIVQLSSRSKGK
jgi:hypothetical protein